MTNIQFRLKLLLCFLAVAIVNGVIFVSLTHNRSKETVKNYLRSNALSIAAAAAVQIDGDLHEQIQNPGEENTAAYQKLEAQLRAIRDANRREDVHVEYIYTMRRMSSNPPVWVYVVDADEPVADGGSKSPIGKVLEWEEQGTEAEEPILLGEAYADRGFVTDEYGTWLSANAPIRNADGEIVAMLGVDFRADDVIEETNSVIWRLFPIFITTVLLTALFAILLSKWMTKPLKEIVAGIQKIGRGHLQHQMDDSRKDEFGEINRAVNEMSASLLERDALKGALSRYVSQEAVQKLIKDGEFPTFRGSRKRMTILLCRISNLETISETVSPGFLVELLNEYFDRMVGVVFSHNGTIDQLPGDGLSAVFGALGEDDKQEKQAVRAALELIQENRKLNEKFNLEEDEQFRLQVGIHTGDAIFGNIGSDHRVEFTVVGKSMRIASALSDLNAQFSTQLLISECTEEKISTKFDFVEVGEVQPGPVGDAVRIFTLTELLPPDVAAEIKKANG